MENLHIIHIGKTAGSSICFQLKKYNINFTNIHTSIPKYNPKYKYIILLRNPIQRFISAFYWRKYLVFDSKKQKNRFHKEFKIFQKYNNINSFIQNYNSKLYIHHIKENISFYLSIFLQFCNKDNILGCITTEFINEDFYNIFNKRINYHFKNNKIEKDKLTKENYIKLKKILEEDYKCINKLYEMGSLSEKQYKILSI